MLEANDGELTPEQQAKWEQDHRHEPRPTSSVPQQSDVDLRRLARRRGIELRSNIAAAINMVSAENGSDTPDFILAEYLANCLAAFDAAMARREKWYGRECGLQKAPLEYSAPSSETR